MKTNLLKSIFISLLLLVGATNAWAYDVKSPHVYFNATNVSSWPGVNIVVGHDSYSFGDLMSKVSNTNLYYAQVTFDGSDANGFVFIGDNSQWGEWKQQSLYNRTQSQSNRTDYLWFHNTITNGLPFGTYYFSTSGNKKAIDYSQYTTIPTFNTTSAVRVRTGTSGTYSNASGTYPANISIQGTYISENGKTNRTSITSTNASDGDDKKIYGSVITGLVTLSYSNLNEAYTFDGWGTSNSKVSSTSTDYVFNQSAHTTVYAFFTKKTYTITYKQGANGSGSIDAGTKEHGVNYTLSSNKFTRTGYTQTGWSTSDGGAKVYDLGGTYTANTNVTLYPFWTPNQYTINYKNQDGSDFSGTHADGAPEKHTYGTETTLKSASKAGYTFGGWYAASDCTGDAITSLGATAYTDNITLYAKWEERKLKINAEWLPEPYYVDNMTRSDNTYAYSKSELSPGDHHFRFLEYDGTFAYDFEDLKRDGGLEIGQQCPVCEFNNVKFNLTHKSDVTITLTLQSDDDSTKPTVRIDATPYYEITLDQTGCAQPGTTTTEVKWGSDMPAIELPVAPIGYTFGGYYTEKNGGGTQYYNENGGSAKAWNVAANTTLYAKWTAIKYNITYTNLGGATHTNAKTYTIEDAITFYKPTPRNGYTFTGWYPASIEKGSTGDKTITAQWTEKPGTTVYLKANDMWKSDGAKLAVYAWNNTENTWLDVEYDDCTGNLLMAEIPAKYNTGIKFVRLNPNPTSDDTRRDNGYNFANAWNQTNDLKIPADNNNLYDLTQEYIYLKPNSNWIQANARFAAYFFGNGDKWVDMTDADGDGYYSCKKPSGYPSVIFCRMSSTTHTWECCWNKTIDLGLIDKNCFVIKNGENDWGCNGKGDGNDGKGVDGEWTNHWDNSQWTTYTAPTFDVTISDATNGTIKVAYNGQTYTSGQTISNVSIHTELNVTFTPATGYVLTNPQVTYADQIAEGVYSICGPSVISAAFTPQGETRVIYLRPNDDWLHNDAIFVAHAWNGDGNSDYVLTTKDNDYTGSYSCTIDSKYDHILFARLDPADKRNINLENAWNKTKDLEIVESIYTTNNQTRFAIGAQIVEGKDKDLYNGEWEKNTPIWGITANFNNWHAEDAVFRGYPGNVDILLHSGTHEFLLYNIKTGSYFHNNGTYTRNYSGQWWTMNEQNNCKLVADVDNAFYHFQMQYVTQVGEFKNQISVTYPTDDVYYVMYKENDNKERISYAITKADNRLDTISFFVDANKDPYIFLLDENKAIVGDGCRILATGGSNPGGAMIQGRRNTAELVIGDGCGVTESGVYNFVVTQTEGEQRFEPTLTHAYKGNYYVRTDAATGGWNDYKQAGNQMTYSSYADKNQSFDHYYCKWVESPETGNNQANVKFCVANNYSHALSDELNGDEIIEKVGIATGCLPDSVNVRFAWDSQTNELSRAYISGSAYAKDRFLVLTGNKYLKDIEGGALNISGLEANEALFADKQNWIYQLDVQANSDTEITLTARYNGKVQTFFGTQKGVMQATNDDYHKVRMIYDFKTNNLIAAWLLDPTQNTEAKSVASNMLIIRENQGEANQINFTNNQDMEIYTAYAVMTFTKDHVLDVSKKGLSKQECTDYWVSFPFDVNLSDVFGFGEYGDQWIMLYYDGAERAEKGGWKGTTYWKYITNRNEVLKAGVGYVLKLNPTKMEKQAFANNATDASLFFPSQGIPTIINHEPTQINVPAHTCEINRDTPGGDRRILDSHWNLIGVPGYANLNEVNTKYTTGNQAENVSFYYRYNASDNTYDAAVATATFWNMHAYMVQFAGTIDWKNDPQFNNIPQQLAARRNSNSNKPEKLTLRLEIAQGEEVADQTFVQMQQEGATHEFDMNLDLTKIINSGANIYTLTNDRIQAAGNALPMDEAMVVPVGVKIDAEGEYTFRMPDGTEGMVVELVDYETYNRTNLLLTDYTVTLPKGTSENRFALHIQPQKDVVTSLENIGEGVNNGEAVNKYLIDGKLIIRTAEGVVYDAQGKRL